MSQYDFSTINDKEFEDLIRDLLTKELEVRLQGFKTGRDKGIDLRYSTDSNENKLIVQTKHYLKSNFSTLLSKLTNEEKPKIEKLNPERYIVVTSMGLSPDNKERIKANLSPFVISTNDIYGCDDINGLLAKFPSIEKKHFKLWFSNVDIIQKIINNGIEGRSAFIEQKIRKNIGLYVIGDFFYKALNILKKEKVLLITGIPGIGKTSLAYLIIYRLLGLDFELVAIDEGIREGEDLFNNDNECKQIFYFDDFLGSNYLDIVQSKNSDKSIVNFIERIRLTKNKYLILTTRSTILNQARSSHETLSRANLDSLRYEIEIKDFNNFEKAKILYNHLYFNNLDNNYTLTIFSNKNYWKIIKHPNYNPRLIEFFTNRLNIKHLSPDIYFDFIIENLNNPNQLWESAFANQLDTDEQFLLFTLLTLGNYAPEDLLLRAFNARLDHEIEKHGHRRKVKVFNRVVENLLDGYIKRTISNNECRSSWYDFINPSLKDYLIDYLNENHLDKWRAIESFIFIEQFDGIIHKKGTKANTVEIEGSEVRKYLELANTNTLLTIHPGKGEEYIDQRLISILYEYRSTATYTYIDQWILDRLISFEWMQLTIHNVDYLLPIIENIDDRTEVFAFFQSNWDIIVPKLMEGADYESQLKRIKGVFQRLNIIYEKYRRDDPIWLDIIVKTVNNVFQTEADHIWEAEMSSIVSQCQAVDLNLEINMFYRDLASEYLLTDEIDPEYDPMKDVDIESLIEENINDSPEELFFDADYRSQHSYSLRSEETIIDNLFSHFEK